MWCLSSVLSIFISSLLYLKELWYLNFPPNSEAFFWEISKAISKRTYYENCGDVSGRILGKFSERYFVEIYLPKFRTDETLKELLEEFLKKNGRYSDKIPGKISVRTHGGFPEKLHGKFPKIFLEKKIRKIFLNFWNFWRKSKRIQGRIPYKIFPKKSLETFPKFPNRIL